MPLDLNEPIQLTFTREDWAIIETAVVNERQINDFHKCQLDLIHDKIYAEAAPVGVVSRVLANIHSRKSP